MRRIVFSPRWLGWHVVTLVAVVTCLLLGRWQLARAGESGDLQNWGYAVQWPVFAVFFVFLWWRMLRMELRAATVEPLVEPAADPAPRAAEPLPAAPRQAEIVRHERDDPELAAYNRYLAELAARDRGD